MNCNSRIYSSSEEVFNQLTLEELRTKVAEAEKILNSFSEQERKLNQDVQNRDIVPALWKDSSNSFASYAKEEAEEIVAFIQQNTEKKINAIICEVKALKVKYDKEAAEVQERIDVKKWHITTILKNLMVYPEDGDHKEDITEES